jgi:hypothetical protein
MCVSVYMNVFFFLMLQSVSTWKGRGICVFTALQPNPDLPCGVCHKDRHHHESPHHLLSNFHSSFYYTWCFFMFPCLESLSLSLSLSILFILPTKARILFYHSPLIVGSRDFGKILREWVKWFILICLWKDSHSSFDILFSLAPLLNVRLSPKVT